MAQPPAHARALNLGPAPSDAASADRAAQCRAVSRPRLEDYAKPTKQGKKKRGPPVNSKRAPVGHSLGGSGATPLRHAQRSDGRHSGLGEWKGQPKARGSSPVKSPNANFPSSRSVVTEVSRQGAALPSDETGSLFRTVAPGRMPRAIAWPSVASDAELEKPTKKILRSRIPCRRRRAATAAAWQRRWGAALRLKPPLHIVILAQCVDEPVWMSCEDVL